MILRRYEPQDCARLAELFYDTVHTVNAADYTPEQLDAWATGRVDLAAWNRSFLEHITVVAIDGEAVVGFGDIAPSGYLDRLYVHAGHQRRGVASAICDALEHAVDVDTLTTHASITARPFFERRGYFVAREQRVVRNGVELANFIMEKRRK